MSTTTTDPTLVRGDPECKYVSVVANVAPNIDPSVEVDVACYMTTDGVDADDEVVLPSGADLSRYEKNKVVMLCHAYGQPGCYYPLPVGKAVWVKKRPNGIMAGIAFARSSPMGREVKGLFDEDMVRSFSIGFRSLESSRMTKAEADSRPDWKAAFARTGGKINVHRRWLLIELSVAPIPANADALRLSYRAKGLVIPSWLKMPTNPEAAPMPETQDPEVVATDVIAKDAGTPDDETMSFKPDDHVLTKGGACGTVKSLHTSGAHRVDYRDDTAGEVHATHEEPVGLVDMHEKDADDKCMSTGMTKAFPLAELKPHPGADADAEATEEKALGKSGGTGGGYTTKPADRAEEDDEEGEVDPDPSDSGPGVKTNDHVKVVAPHYKGYGVVKSLHDSGHVPHVEEEIRGTKDNPAARVKCYKAMGDGFVPTEDHVGVRTKHLEVVGPLQPPSKKAARPTAAKTTAPAVAPEPLPPLVALNDEAVQAELVKTIKGLPGYVTEELRRLTGCIS